MNKTYVIIYCFYSFIVYIVAILSNYVRSKKSGKKLILVILIVLGALIAALRPEKTQDTEIYNLAYLNSLPYLSNIKITNVLSIFANRSFYNIELFYVIIMACFRFFFIKPNVFYFVQAIISNAVMVQGLYLLCEYIYGLDTKEKRNKFICKKIILMYGFYQMFCGLLYTSSAIRDGLSISIGLFAIASLLTNKRKIISVVLLVTSVLIHTTSIILILIYIVLKIWKYEIHEKYIWILTMLIPISYFLKIGAVLVEFVIPIIENGLQLLHIQAFYSYITQLDYRLPMREGYIIVLTCFIIAMFIKKNVKTDKYIAVTFIGLIIFIIAYPIPALARLLYIFILFLIPVTMASNRLGELVYLVWGLYFVPQYIYVFGYL